LSNKTFGEILASENKDYFYLMHLSYGRDLDQRKRLWEIALSKNMIGLDLPEEVKRNWVNLSVEEQESVGTHWKWQFNRFCNDMHVGDYVVILNGTHSILGIAKVTEPRHLHDRKLSDRKNPNRFFDHYRQNIYWLLKHQWDGYPLPEKLTFDGTLDKVTPKTRSPRWKVLTAIQL
jgi:hypothetical protein